MRNNRRSRVSRQKAKKEQLQIRKTIFQTIVAVILLVVIWLFSASKQPKIEAFCDKIRQCLTYTVDVRSVFRPLVETNNSGVNENAH